MRINLWSVVVAAVLGVSLMTGCARKPKLDLTGLRGSAPGTEEGVMGASSDFDAKVFDPLAAEGGAGSENTAEGGGAWSDPSKPLGGNDAAAAGNIVPIQERWAQVKVYFAYDSAVIGPAERPKLETLAATLKEYPNYSVIIEGHCDQRGSDEYNRALGETRALVVRDYLMSLGIDGGRLETVSYGEERPAVPNATTEAEYSKNRRVEFVIGVRQ